jgi:hypothetical protein
VKARFKNRCHMCCEDIPVGSEIRKSRSGKWIHKICADFAAVTAEINAGSTLASQKRSDWKMGKG